MDSQRAYREYNYMPFIVPMKAQKGGQKLPTNQPPNVTNHLIEQPFLLIIS